MKQRNASWTSSVDKLKCGRCLRVFYDHSNSEGTYCCGCGAKVEMQRNVIAIDDHPVVMIAFVVSDTL